MKIRLLLFLLLIAFQSFAQQKDSLLQVQYQEALAKFKDGNYSVAVTQFTQLINSGFSNKEVYVKRGVSYFQLKEYEK